MAQVLSPLPFASPASAMDRAARRRSSGDSWETSVSLASLTSLTSSSSGVPTSQDDSNTKKHSTKRSSRGPDLVIHVQGCAFGVSSYLLKRKCFVLYNHLRRLRVQSSSGSDLASDEIDALQMRGPAARGDPVFVLRQREQGRSTRNSLTPPRAITTTACPAAPPQQAPGDRKRSGRFKHVTCLNHKKKPEEASDTAKTVRTGTRIPSLSSTPPWIAFQRMQQQHTPPPRPEQAPTEIELEGADAEAVATLLEFLHSGKSTSLQESSAAQVVALCRWLCMENQLLYAAMVKLIDGLQSSEQWITLLLKCAKLQNAPNKRLLIDHLLVRFLQLSPEQAVAVVEAMPLQRLAVLKDPDLLARVMVCLFNHARHLEIWKRMVFVLELWMSTLGRRSLSHVVAVPLPPMPLPDFHDRFAEWHPVARLESLEVSGPHAYVSPTTLFTFGSYAFQVRLEREGTTLIQWRVMKAKMSVNQDNAKSEPPFTLRGRLTIRYRSGTYGALMEEDVPILYNHSPQQASSQWKVLLRAASKRARRIEESEEKTEEESSEEQPEQLPPPSTNDNNAEDEDEEEEEEEEEDAYARTYIKAIFPVRSKQLEPAATRSKAFDLMTARFSGQCFAWGHRICNLYHYLLLVTLFYQSPVGAPREIVQQSAVERMKKLPVETLLVVLESDRLRIPGGETTLVSTLTALCLNEEGYDNYSVEQIRALFRCVRWCFVDLEQIMQTLEQSRRELELYELIDDELDPAHLLTVPRRTPWGKDDDRRWSPYHAVTTQIEFEIEAGDRSLSPSKFPSFST
ncbi:hypothetical protein Poli38472_006959 [Pythium oligandrum]|uniref:Uncharacterized protein n=1 Tax=Pythium oligandrum TaxID=41045 RepID=A0A8K1FFB3_PYTOL|nr:hypothetical protein Poli38472_006959 [Pythium oligandrum]|eukprot:TMW58814.1 hypothetical protein Poli38472_006959 [Pythium oligandrum]